jgi:hypothetical protein
MIRAHQHEDSSSVAEAYMSGHARDPTVEASHIIQALDDLQSLAAIEHSLIVEYLTVCYALGHDLDTGEGGPKSDQLRDVAMSASTLSLSSMFQLKRMWRILVEAGRDPTLDRASRVETASGGDIKLAPLENSDLHDLVNRERDIAKAVDHQNRRLLDVVEVGSFGKSDPLDEIKEVIRDGGLTHFDAATALVESLVDLTPTEYLRATRREGADSTERRLLDHSDKLYSLTLSALRFRLSPDSTIGQSLPVGLMESLDDANRLLVQRGILPSFTAP